MNPLKVADPQSSAGQASDQLADRIDPNTASASEIAAIPNLGEKKAQAIVDFRERFKARHPDHPAFARLSDLEQISGIGAATAENTEPYLLFPTDSATQKAH
jgi:competence protein ComEA